MRVRVRGHTLGAVAVGGIKAPHYNAVERGKSERIQRRSVFGAIGGHGVFRKTEFDFRIFGESRGGEAHY
jgi:hypothetical protein